MRDDVITPQLLAEMIRRYYPVGHVQTPKPFEGAHQRRHHKLTVQTDAGLFLVKTYPRKLAILDALRFQHRLAVHLLRCGLPTARILRARDGSRIVEVDDWAFEVQEFIDAQTMRVTPETLQIAGYTLARFHNECRDLPCPPRDPRVWRFADAPRDGLEMLYRRAIAEGGGDDSRANCNRVVLFVHDALKALPVESRSEFETGLIHGDWHAGNLLFRDDNLAAIVDLEFAGMGCFLEDIASAVSNLCIRTAAKAARICIRMEYLLKGYQSGRPMPYYEQASLYYAAGLRHVGTVSRQIPRNNGRVSGLTAVEWLERLALQCEWLSICAKKTNTGPPVQASGAE